MFAFKRCAVENTQFFYFSSNIREMTEYGKTEIIYVEHHISIHIFGNGLVNCRLDIILEDHRQNHCRCYQDSDKNEKANQQFFEKFHKDINFESVKLQIH